MNDDLEPKDPGDNCNARRTDGSGYCGQPAGWGTDHTGVGRCKFHGGNTKNQEKNIIDELQDAVDDGGVAYRLKLKHVKEKAENGDLDDVDWSEFDRLFRTGLDRTGVGPEETQKVAGEDGGAVEYTVNYEVVESVDE